jgi:HK97 family phage portal protein
VLVFAEQIDFGWSAFNMVKTRSGVAVDQRNAYTYSAVWCATRVIAETLSSIPLTVRKRLPTGGSDPVPEHPVSQFFSLSPCEGLAAVPFRESRIAHQVNWGNGFAEIERNNAGDPIALRPIHPSWISPAPIEALENGFPYRIRMASGAFDLASGDQILHVPGVLSEDGLWGKGVIQHARESIGFGLSTERHGATFFGSGAQPRGVVKMAGYLDQEKRRAFRAEWKALYGSPDASEVAILPPEGSYQPVTLSNEDSQFLETRKFNVNEIARWYRVPPHLLMDLDRATFSNIEHQSIEFVRHLVPWTLKWEAECTLKLLSEEEREDGLFISHDFASLLVGDVKSRYESYSIALQSGVLSLNEAREKEGLAPVAGGEKNWMPLNLGVVGSSTENAAIAPQPAIIYNGGILQESDWDCGAAAVGTVLQSYGKAVELKKLIEDIGSTPKDGTSMGQITEYLSGNGFGISVETNSSIQRLTDSTAKGEPVICAIQYLVSDSAKTAGTSSGHWVVVLGVSALGVTYHDPAEGLRILPLDTWSERWKDRTAKGVDVDRLAIFVRRQ